VRIGIHTVPNFCTKERIFVSADPDTDPDPDPGLEKITDEKKLFLFFCSKIP
jgi:hypothetical protein